MESLKPHSQAAMWVISPMSIWDRNTRVLTLDWRLSRGLLLGGNSGGNWQMLPKGKHSKSVPCSRCSVAAASTICVFRGRSSTFADVLLDRVALQIAGSSATLSCPWWFAHVRLQPTVLGGNFGGNCPTSDASCPQAHHRTFMKLQTMPHGSGDAERIHGAWIAPRQQYGS
jgi:hypothetical protein